MNPFPFTSEEWEKVQEASRALTNPTLADDDILEASHLRELQAVLEELRTRYGDHPVLLETEADFQNDPRHRVVLYRAALQLAEKYLVPTVSIRLSLAEVLLADLGDSTAAAKELDACRSEIGTDADERDLVEWSRLRSQCAR
jgi:hypothetical protein